MAENKVRFLRGTAAEYANAVKDDDTFYYTTDDEKFYVGNKEITGGGITVDSNLSDTSTNPVQNKVIKAAIDDKADKAVATTTADGLMSAADKTKLDGADDTYALKSKYGDTTINVGRKADTKKGVYSTAEGYNTTASGHYSHAEGEGTTASGDGSHAGGYNTTASGIHSHAEGCETTASGAYSHAGGTGTKALHGNEVAYGKYNESKDDTVFSIGDGTSDTARHNAFEITTTGGKLHDKDIATTNLIPDLSSYAKTADVPNIKVNEAVNADTIKGRQVDDFAQIIDLTNATSTKIAVGYSGKTTVYRCTSWTDIPIGLTDGQGVIIAINYSGTGTAGVNQIWCTQIFISAHGNIFIRNMSNIDVDSWQELYRGEHKPYVTGSFSGTAASFHFDYAPSFALVNDEGNIKFGDTMIFTLGGYDVHFDNLSDTTHQYIIFK